jgi:antibiotic biosynthesis monooxygenase (ABM) superfamily enzyme
MTQRRDQFVLVAAPGKAAEALSFLTDWIRAIDGHPGYLGGAVLKESAGEVFDDTFVLTLEFDSTVAAKALWPKIEGKLTPIEPVGGVQTNDQGGLLFDWIAARGDDHQDPVGKAAAAAKLDFDRGGGLFARVIHLHCEIVDRYTSTGSAPG